MGLGNLGDWVIWRPRAWNCSHTRKTWICYFTNRPGNTGWHFWLHCDPFRHSFFSHSRRELSAANPPLWHCPRAPHGPWDLDPEWPSLSQWRHVPPCRDSPGYTGSCRDVCKALADWIQSYRGRCCSLWTRWFRVSAGFLGECLPCALWKIPTVGGLGCLILKAEWGHFWGSCLPPWPVLRGHNTGKKPQPPNEIMKNISSSDISYR